jgi:hypothetical protein
MSLPRRSTDFGTVILHALLVVSFAVLVATGLRIAADDPGREWLAFLDPVLPVGHLWYRHLVAGVGLIAILTAYASYIIRARLSARVQLDTARLLAMSRPGRSRWSSINVLVYWILMASLATDIVTGVMLFGGAGHAVLDLHLQATFVSVAAVVTHVALHAAYGGLPQLLRIFRPARLHIQPAPPDLAELLAEQLAARAANSIEVKPAAEKSTTLQAHPLATALIVGSAVCGLAFGAEQATRPTLRVVEIDRTEAPRLDGDLSDPAWIKAKPATVLTTQGGDFGGTHQSQVEVGALHDGEDVYFSFVWEDPTRSLKHMPLFKRDGRWQVAATRADLGDESKFHEDKFSVLLARPGLPLIGAAIHLARKPLDNKPPSSTGRGLHYTPDGSIADVWQWRASHGGPMGHIDNSHFGGPGESPLPNSTSHYAGGFAPDPTPLPYQSNFMEINSVGGSAAIMPRRLPRDLAALSHAMGRVSGASVESESEGARWWMTKGESEPYSAALDAKIPDGAVIPSILFADADSGNRTSIRGTARWAAGRWTLELARRLHTGTPYDMPIKSGVLMWLAAFDHAEKRHTRHLRPFRLEVD